MIRLRVNVRGVVQGVGFRPAAHRLALQMGLAGWVTNTSDGAMVEVEGADSHVHEYVDLLASNLPSQAIIGAMTARKVPATGEDEFRILPSIEHGARDLAVPPDLAPCDACQREQRDPTDRRFDYPFIACSFCGPRYSVLTGIPYDRMRTTLADFPLCAPCLREYEDPADRRYHAESTACPACGPRIALVNARGQTIGDAGSALHDAADLLRRGGILAVKALGGFQLWVDARDRMSVERLRERKHRPHKPLAVLFASLDAVRACCEVSDQAAALLVSPQSPIVILPRRSEAGLAAAVAPGNPTIGAMLPSTPLHSLMTSLLQFPVIATSGNRSEEPLATDNQEALRRLAGIADLFLIHDRPIARPIDDSVMRLSDTGPVILRRARGYVPTTLPLAESVRGRGAVPPILAIGGHLKNTVGFCDGERVILSQHLGDLSTAEAIRGFRQAVRDLSLLLEKRPACIACDLHPEYYSSAFAAEMAREWRLPLLKVQHHHAHVASCMAEHGLTGRVLGVVWDGSGYGPDGTLWGGEFLLADYGVWERRAHLLPFRLPGGEHAVRDPRRAALSLLLRTFGDDALATARRLWPEWDREPSLLCTMIDRGVHTPTTSSMGRLFDAVASLTGLSGSSTFEGQAAMAVEFAAGRFAATMRDPDTDLTECYNLPLRVAMWPGSPIVVDWRPLVQGVLADLERGRQPDRIAYGFHVALANLVSRVAVEAGVARVVLTGGCFQNMLLTRLTRQRLSAAGFEVYTHAHIPPNDGGLALGQVMVAAAQGAAGAGPEASGNG